LVASTYALSNGVVFPKVSATYPIPEGSTSVPRHLKSPRNGKAVVDFVNENLLQDYDAQGLCKTLFSRRHPNRIKAGSVLSVVSYNNASRTHTSTFSGVLMGIRRRGVDTGFTLRNIVNKTGVEMHFKVCSPMVKDIQVVKRALKGKNVGGLRDPRRAKVNYLRDRPQMMTQIAAAVKQSKA
jgi:large subunit ribosomal protein L19